MTPDHPRWEEFVGRLDAALHDSPRGCHGGDENARERGGSLAGGEKHGGGTEPI
jgi:hypothetical protein